MAIKKVIIVILIIIVILLGIYFLLQINSNKDESKVNSGKSGQEVIIKSAEEINQEEIEFQKTLTEKERIKRYVTLYILDIERQDYDKAYSRLYPDFKNNYFKTVEKYKEYVDELYPSTIVLQYGNITREGHYYIVSADIVDPRMEQPAISHKFIIYETGYNDFVVSFEVI